MSKKKHDNGTTGPDYKAQQAEHISQKSAEKYEDTHFIDTSKPVWNYSMLTDEDVRNFQNGTHYSLYEKFGAHSIQLNQVWGMYFCVWAPNATLVTVKGNFNDWNDNTHPL